MVQEYVLIIYVNLDVVLVMVLKYVLMVSSNINLLVYYVNHTCFVLIQNYILFAQFVNLISVFIANYQVVAKIVPIITSIGSTLSSKLHNIISLLVIIILLKIYVTKSTKSIRKHLCFLRVRTFKIE